MFERFTDRARRVVVLQHDQVLFDERENVVAVGVQKLDPAQKVRVVSSLSF